MAGMATVIIVVFNGLRIMPNATASIINLLFFSTVILVSPLDGVILNSNTMRY